MPVDGVSRVLEKAECPLLGGRGHATKETPLSQREAAWIVRSIRPWRPREDQSAREG
jgi:hypothetical protein